MCNNATPQCRQTVATFKKADHPARSRFARNPHDLVCNPAVIGFHKPQLPHVVFAVAIEAGRHENKFGPECQQPGHPEIGNQHAQFIALGVGLDGDVHHVFRRMLVFGAGKNACLKETAHEHATVAGEDVLDAVAMMDIEVDDGNTLEPVMLKGIGRRHSDIVDETETHDLVSGGMMTRGTNRTKRRVGMTLHDGINGCNA